MPRMGPKIALRGFKPGRRGAARVLGELEAAVMEFLWAQPGQTVVEVEECIRRRREIAHTTVLTTLDRMHRKGYLTRTKDSTSSRLESPTSYGLFFMKTARWIPRRSSLVTMIGNSWGRASDRRFRLSVGGERHAS